MNLQWDYDHYQPWSDNKWLVEEMLVLLVKEVMMHHFIIKWLELTKWENIGLTHLYTITQLVTSDTGLSPN